MPKYIFEVAEDGQTDPSVTLDLADDRVAREEAMRTIGEIMSGDLPTGDSKSLAIYVRYAKGDGIFTIRLKLETEWHRSAKDRRH
jgi:hypothetical protein